MGVVIAYGTAPRKTRKLVKITVIVLASAGLAVLGFNYRHAVSDRISLLYWQRRAENYSVPAGTVVYEEDPERAKELKSKYGYVEADWSSTYKVMPPAPRCLKEISELYEGFPESHPLVFLHSMVSPSGNRRLVLVLISEPFMDVSDFPGGVYAHVKKPVRPSSVLPIIFKSEFFSAQMLGHHSPPPPIRVFAGQLDPSNASHFTFDYEFGSDHGIVDGWLGDNDRITLKVRSGPATQPDRYP